jgi:NAD(P)-dependent dehydrogenase (short-subunit alcohol dehydrogenase family)
MGSLHHQSNFFATTQTANMAMRKVLVTGGNKGIGYAICLSLLRDHPDVSVILGCRDATRGQSAIQDLEAQVANAKGRVNLLLIDVASPESIERAAAQVEGPLFGIVNNAAVGYGTSQDTTLFTNYYGVRCVTDAFLPKLQSPGGRIVNVGSAAGPLFIAALSDDDSVKALLSEPWRLKNEGGGVGALDKIADTYRVKDEGPDSWNSYGLSKALVSAYTYLLSRLRPDLVINAVSPGLVKTDLTAGMDSSLAKAAKTPEEGAVPILHCLLSEKVAQGPQGRYYGSDCLRSPLHKYRDPGTAEYYGPED